MLNRYQRHYHTCALHTLSCWSSMKGRCLQGPIVEKLKREVARLHGELERVEKEVSRQKTLRWLIWV